MKEENEQAGTWSDSVLVTVPFPTGWEANHDHMVSHVYGRETGAMPGAAGAQIRQLKRSGGRLCVS